ncbi:MAG: ECF transporter S component [Bacilli bacterium]|nr:ECF transporter S component [Bacilli bacterium]MBN2877759.1 ECF transporter S component [Bacilli bacterium]
MTEKRVMSKRDKTREMTIIAMFMAIIVVMGFVPQIGFITIFAVSATLIHIPVLIGGALLGRRAGIILGLTFGAVSLIRGATSGGFDFVFVFPWVSILPRFIFGLLIYDVYHFFNKLIKARIVALSVSFLLLSLLHSVMVLPMMVTTFPIIVNNASLGEIVGGDYLTLMQDTNSLSLALKLIWGVLITNSLVEAALAASVGAIVADRLIQYLKFNNNTVMRSE